MEGQNVTFEPRWALDDTDRLSKLAAELVGLKVDVIVTAATVSALAAKRATATIPIVMATGVIQFQSGSLPISGSRAETSRG